MEYSKKEVGRPKKDLTVLPDGWYNNILELYKQGASDVEVKALIYGWLGSFSNDLWDRWMKEESEFSETIKYGKLLSESWWAKKGRVNLENKYFSFTGWYMNMKNRFNWSDKTVNENSNMNYTMPSLTKEEIEKYKKDLENEY